MVKRGLGISIVSTSRGLMTGRAAKRLGIGGEVVATIF
jgi:small subunit ribosomal protein S8